MGGGICRAEACGAEQTFVVLEFPAGLQLGDGQGAPAE